MEENQQETTQPKLEVLANTAPDAPAFANKTSFEHAQRVALMLSKSSLVPERYQGDKNIQNAIIALEMANRMGASPLMVMQNLYVVKGNPGWSSSFIIAAINASKRFTPLRFKFDGDGDSRSCYAFAEDVKTGVLIEGTKITWKMVKAEGWLDKSGSKWQTMPDQMFCYRAASFFGRLYAPDLLMGMQTVEEIQDVVDANDSKKEESIKVADDVLAVLQSKKSEVKVTPPPAAGTKEDKTDSATTQGKLI